MALPASLSKANLVPGAAAPLIPSDFRATVELGVSFGPQAISLGNLVRNSQVTRAPRIKISSDVCCIQGRSGKLMKTNSMLTLRKEWQILVNAH